jgi:hypothetical protein
MKNQKLLDSLIRSSYAISTMDDLSTISQGKWKTRPDSIHLLDHHVLFQQSTTCPQYQRFNESPETIGFTYSIIICYSNNRRLVLNVTGWMNGQTLVHPLTWLSYAIPTIDELSTLSQVQWMAVSSPFTYSIMICYSNSRGPVHNIRG